MDVGWAVTSTMLSGIFLFGGIGWLLDRWWGTRFVVAIGVIVGLAVAIYAIVMRYGRNSEGAPPDAPANDRGAVVTNGSMRRER